MLEIRWAIDVDDARHFHRRHTSPARDNCFQEATHPVTAGGNGLRGGAADPGAQAVDPARNAGGMDRLVAHGLDVVTATPDPVHGGPAAPDRTSTDHQLPAP